MNSVKNAWGPAIVSWDSYSVMSPAICLARIAGIFPLSSKGHVGCRNYSMSYTSLIYSTAVHVVTLTGLLMWAENFEKRLNKKADPIITQLIHDSRLVIQLTSTIVLLASIILAKEKMANTVNNICAQDEALKNLGIRFDYAADFRRSCIRLGIIISINSAICIYDFLAHSKFNLRYPLVWMARFNPYIGWMISSCFFADISIIVKQKFSALNETLEKIIQKSKVSSLETLSSQLKTSTQIRAMAKIHGNLCGSVSSLNEIFGLNFVIGAVLALAILTVSVYHVIEIIQDPTGNCLEIYTAANLGIMSSIHLVYIVMVCEMAKNEANLTGELIHKFDIQLEIDSALNIAIQSFSLQLHHENIQFSGAGFFPLDATLIRSIVGAVTTYVVIMIQFSDIRTT